MVSSNHYLVTVVIPVYNVERYLAQCIESVLGQDYSNKEILIINDGSTDGGTEIINMYKKNYSTIRVVETENRGLSLARNLGKKLALGDFILFLDSDDYLVPNALRKCIEIIEHHNSDIVMFSGDIISASNGSSIFPLQYYVRPKELTNISLQSRYLFEELISLNRYIPSACLYMFRKDKFRLLEFYPGILFEDNLFTTKLLLNSPDTYSFCIADTLYMRRIREGSITNQTITSHHYVSYLVVVEELLKLKEEGFESATLKSLDIYIQKIILACIETHFRLGNSLKENFFRFKMISYLRRVEVRNIRLHIIFLLLFPCSITTLKSFRNRWKQ